MCLTCTLVVISMGYVLSVIQTFPAPVVSSTNLMPISFSIPLVFSPSNSIPMCTLRVQFHSHLLRKNVRSNLFVCSMAMNNKVWIVTPKYVPAGWNPQVMAAPKLWCQSARLHAPVVLLMLAKQLSDWCDRATAQQGAIDFEKSLLGVRCDGSKTIWNPLMPFQLADVQSELHTRAVFKLIFIQQQFPYFPTLYPIISITQHVYIFHRAGCGGDMTLFRDLCWNAQYQGTNLGRSWMTGVA